MADAKSYFISGLILTITNDQNYITIGNFISFIVNLSLSWTIKNILQCKDEEMKKDSP